LPMDKAFNSGYFIYLAGNVRAGQPFRDFGSPK